MRKGKLSKKQKLMVTLSLVLIISSFITLLIFNNIEQEYREDYCIKSGYDGYNKHIKSCYWYRNIITEEQIFKLELNESIGIFKG